MISKKPRQTSGFLNRYDFAYAGRDTANQIGKIAPGVIKNASTETKGIAQERMQQATYQGGNELKRVLPKIFEGAIEDNYQTPFRLVRNFGKKQFQKIKNKILK